MSSCSSAGERWDRADVSEPATINALRGTSALQKTSPISAFIPRLQPSDAVPAGRTVSTNLGPDSTGCDTPPLSTDQEVGGSSPPEAATNHMTPQALLAGRIDCFVRYDCFAPARCKSLVLNDLTALTIVLAVLVWHVRTQGWNRLRRGIYEIGDETFSTPVEFLSANPRQASILSATPFGR